LLLPRIGLAWQPAISPKEQRIRQVLCTLEKGRQADMESLRTDVYSVVQARLAKHVKEVKSARKTTESVERGKALGVESLINEYLDGVRKAVDIKPSTVHYREQLIVAIRKTWPELASMAPKGVTEKNCADWAKRFADTYSPTRYNNGVDTIRGIFNVGIDQGMIFRNPAAGLSKRKPGKKHLELPSRDEFTKIVQTVRNSGAWCQTQVGDLIEFLAYSGCRVAEASFVKWSDVENDSIWIHGDPARDQRRR
jgi:integrase